MPRSRTSTSTRCSPRSFRGRGDPRVDTCAVLLLDERAQRARRARGGRDRGGGRAGVRIPLGKGFAGRVAAERRAVVLDDSTTRTCSTRSCARRESSRCWVCRCWSAATCSACCTSARSRRGRSADDDVELLQLAADRAALAIEHARAFDAERGRAQRLEHVQARHRRRARAPRARRAARPSCSRIRTPAAPTRAPSCFSTSRRRARGARGQGIEEEVERGVRIPCRARLRRAGSPPSTAGRVDDLADTDVHNPILREKGIRSMLGVPLLVRATRSASSTSAPSPAASRTGTQSCSSSPPTGSPWRSSAPELYEETVRLDRLKARLRRDGLARAPDAVNEASTARPTMLALRGDDIASRVSFGMS